MRPAPPSSRYESHLSREDPFLTKEGRLDARERRELEEHTATIQRVDNYRQIAFKRELENVRCRVNYDFHVLLDGVSGIAPPGDLVERAPQPPLSFELVKGPPKHNTSKLFHPVPCVSGNSSAAALKQPQGKVLAPREQNMEAALPIGFPLPFEASGFRCVKQWAETSFREVLLTALGPQSQREHMSPLEPPNRLLVSVACYLLNEIVSREPGMRALWPVLRRVIFGGVFVPRPIRLQLQQKSKVGKELEVNHNENNTESYPPYPSFELLDDFVEQRLWSDAFSESQKKGMELTKQVGDFQDVVRKNRLVLRYAQRRIERFRLKHAFFAWRKMVARTIAFREAATAYLTRVRRRIHVEGSFIRWRRIAVQSQVLTLSKLVKDLELRLAMAETKNGRVVETLSQQVEEEKRTNKILMQKEEALKSQLGESHVDALRILHSEIRRKHKNFKSTQKLARRWERLAKTFTFSEACIRVPKVLRRVGLALQRMEDDFALEISLSHDFTGEARRCLEVFLLDWANFVMKDSSSSTSWNPVAGIDSKISSGHFGANALLQLVRELGDLYVSRGAKSLARANRRPMNRDLLSAMQAPRSIEEGFFDTLYTELCWLLSLQSMEGLYPSLLTHCRELETFFTPQLFCRRPHPTAMLWILSTLFLGYTRLITGDYVIAERNFDSRLRCRDELQFGISLAGHNDFATSTSHEAVRSQTSIVSHDTHVRKMTAKPSQISEEMDSVHLPTIAMTSSRLVSPISRRSSSEWLFSDTSANDAEDCPALDTLSDLELYLGLDKGAVSDENENPPSLREDDDEDDDEGPDTGRAESTEGARTDVTMTSSEARTRWQRVRRRQHNLPPVSSALSSTKHRKFVAMHESEKRRKRVWLGLARVVSSLVTRCRVLDAVEKVEMPAPPVHRRRQKEIPKSLIRSMNSIRMKREAVPTRLRKASDVSPNVSVNSRSGKSEGNTSNLQSILKDMLY